MKVKLKLYVWTDFCQDYSPGLAFAIAANETEAREMIEADKGYSIYDWGHLTIHPVTRRFAKSVPGGG